MTEQLLKLLVLRRYYRLHCAVIYEWNVKSIELNQYELEELRQSIAVWSNCLSILDMVLDEFKIADRNKYDCANICLDYSYSVSTCVWNFAHIEYSIY